MIDKTVIDPNALQFYRMLKEAGFSAYFVGGSVRDLLLGKQPKDFDIATNATPHQIKRIIPHGRIIGRRFRHVMLERSGSRYEIVTFRGPILHPGEDLAELEEEAKSHSEENKDPEAPTAPQQEAPEKSRKFPDLNQFGNAEQDALRRDFTINALFYDPDADELVDYVEGKLDIDNKIVRSIGDPYARMTEDPIRILRAIRHKMKLNLEYDAELEAAMKEKANLLEETSKDRIREEFLKVCQDQSLGSFLVEAKRLNLNPFLMPWFSEIDEESWNEGVKLWEQFQKTNMEKPNPDMGLALMMVPLIKPLVLDPYRKLIPEGEKNYLPDMKYFLSCEQLRNYYLRNLRISRAQTDHVIRALFYFSRMTGLWLEQGPPRRVIGRLFQHPPAVLAAKMARIQLNLWEKEVPSWLGDLADYDPRARKNRSEHHRSRTNQNDNDFSEQRESRGQNQTNQDDDLDDSLSAAKMHRLPPPDKPMVWNGPLHAPVLRPIFAEEQTIRWARKNQTMRAYRPSGIPNPPIDYALLKASLVNNYKPEIDPNTQREEEENRSHRHRSRKEHKDNRRPRHHRNQQHHKASAPDDEIGNQNFEESKYQTPPPGNMDEDSIGNILRPGELPAALQNASHHHGMSDVEIDDNIGNRLDSSSRQAPINEENAEPMLTHHMNRSQHSHRRSGGHSSSRRNSTHRNSKRRGRKNHSHSRSHHHKPSHQDS